jgi:hypothetical protein
LPLRGAVHEPTQLAGFPQSFRTVISESIAGSVAAPETEVMGLALDLKFGTGTFAGLTVNTGSPYCGNQTVLAGWSMITIYQDASLTGKTLVLYDGFDITRKRLLDLGCIIPATADRTPQALQSRVESEVLRWAAVLKAQ